MKLIRELRAEIDKLKSMMGQVNQSFCEIIECNSAKPVSNTLLKVAKDYKKGKTLIFVKNGEKAVWNRFSGINYMNLKTSF